MSFLLPFIGALSDSGINPGSAAKAGLPFAHNALQNKYSKEQINAQTQGQQSLQTDVQNQFTKYGLPSYMAYTSGSGSAPTTRFNLGGSNYYNSGTAGANMPNVTNNYQQYMNWGNPFQKNPGTVSKGNGLIERPREAYNQMEYDSDWGFGDNDSSSMSSFGESP